MAHRRRRAAIKFMTPPKHPRGTVPVTVVLRCPGHVHGCPAVWEDTVWVKRGKRSYRRVAATACDKCRE